jgi:hypothetical protein
MYYCNLNEIRISLYIYQNIQYTRLAAKETSWEHILALEYVLLKYGFPLAYYVDSHSILSGFISTNSNTFLIY